MKTKTLMLGAAFVLAPLSSNAEIHIDVIADSDGSPSETYTATNQIKDFEGVSKTTKSLEENVLYTPTTAEEVGSIAAYGITNRQSETFNGIPFYSVYVDGFRMSLIPKGLYDTIRIGSLTDSSDSSRSLNTNFGFNLSPYGKDNGFVEIAAGNRGYYETTGSFHQKSENSNTVFRISKERTPRNIHNSNGDHTDNFGVSAVNRYRIADNVFLDSTVLHTRGDFKSTGYYNHSPMTQEKYLYEMSLLGSTLNINSKYLDSRTSATFFDYNQDNTHTGYSPLENHSKNWSVSQRFNIKPFASEILEIAPAIQYSQETFDTRDEDIIDKSRYLVKTSLDAKSKLGILGLHYGVTNDNSNAFKNETYQQFMASLDLGTEQKLFAKVQEQYRLPAFGSVYYGSIMGGLWGDTDNLDLQPEKSLKKEVGIIHSGKDIQASVSAYDIRYKDKIVISSDWTHFDNLEHSEAKGLLLSAETNWPLILGVDWSYTYTDDTLIPKNIVMSKIGYKFLDQKILLTNRYQSKSDGLKEFSSWGITYEYDNVKDGWNLQLSAQNFLDTIPDMPERVLPGQLVQAKFRKYF